MRFDKVSTLQNPLLIFLSLSPFVPFPLLSLPSSHISCRLVHLKRGMLQLHRVNQLQLIVKGYPLTTFQLAAMLTISIASQLIADMNQIQAVCPQKSSPSSRSLAPSSWPTNLGTLPSPDVGAWRLGFPPCQTEHVLVFRALFRFLMGMHKNDE